MTEKMKQLLILLGGGVVVTAVAILLASNGNPQNMAICVACFIRDIAGGLHLQNAEVVQYIRPEIIGIVLGALLMSIIGKEFKASAGSSPMTRFALGFIMMIGALVFLGCPLRMVLRMSAGDLNAWIGLIGFAGGVFTGVIFLKKGFSLGRATAVKTVEGLWLPVLFTIIFILSITTTLFASSVKGPGSMHAAVALSLIGGILFGAVAQKTRLCFAGGLRDVFLMKEGRGLIVIGILFAGMLTYNLISGNFKLSMDAQPIAHSEVLWNVLGLYVVGFSAILLGGCPLRQLVLAGSGSSDSAVTFLGLLVGAAFCHNFGIASSAAGTTTAGQIATVVCIVLLFAIALVNCKKKA